MKRAAGILLSITSLPSKYGIGCFDRTAYRFVDWLAEAGQTYWQILPLAPTSYGPSDDSPYQAYSAFAGNPYFISLEELIQEGVLTKKECDSVDFGTDPTMVDYEKLHNNRYALLHKAYERSDISKNEEYQQFLRENNWWLADYALFMALKNFFHEQPWTQWPQDIRLHWGFALDYYRRELYFDVEFQQYMQFKFFQQWRKLKAYANSKGIKIIGDIPIYVSPDSADVWAHPELFQLDENNNPRAIAGCPPDAFSADGQVWGNPLYNWDYHRSTDYSWWISRLWASFELYDLVRIDHFRAFDEYFSVPCGDQTALNGHWEKGPGLHFFERVRAHLGEKALIAEDLGLMTDTVRQLVQDTGFPNMKVLQFAFDEGDTVGYNDYLPHNYRNNCVAYTGTHDNETLAGWLSNVSKGQMKQIRTYLDDFQTPDKDLYRKILNLAMMSAADTCIVPIQDHLGMDNTCRMNHPSTVGKNWRWRLEEKALTKQAQEEILTLTKRYGRMNWANCHA